MIGATSLGALALFSIPWFRQWSYEIFLRGHQILTGFFIYGTWRHLPAKSGPPRLYFWIALGMLGLTSCLQLMSLLYRNGLFAGRGAPRALVSFTFRKSKDSGLTVTAARIRVLLPRPIQVEAGQYINLWIPSDTLELLVQPRRGLSADLVHHASVGAESSVSFLALFTGPHGTSEDVSQYESALLIASGFGIAATIPYLKKMIYGYNTCTLQIRRLHLVWQVESIAQGLLNSLLEDDIIDKGYILNISIYVKNGLAHNRIPFGEHERVCLYQGMPDYRGIISLEASGDQIERLPNIRDEQGRTLVMVSTTDELRDHIREIVRGYLHQGVVLSEVEYQPNAG
ncbi:hypothetical protein CBS147321_1042 [Aspergillus niger]|nr:hypothetical protein CBS133816_8556 [Aspergillus niger]KAI2943090.1 hypothetical protein CBS147322_8621 [Aspergillus niger]KAI2951630.1 hypothetical protein CBS147321_1042 [Aspergillus niger]KAI2962523.1 hypothetical protein CBS147324_9403 [Aspergillus niger]KAI3025070.1 hypothetical protein CBS147347_5857 [Aspergillus niger]